MSAAALAAIALLGLVAGTFIGSIGIGGVAIVPVLVALGGISIHVAIAAAMMSFLVSGAVGTLVFWRESSIRWDMAATLSLAAMPGAVLGALTTGVTASFVLELAVALVTVAAGLNALLAKAPPAHHDGRQLGRPALAALGAITGFVSAMTGTGGPLVLIPLLLWLDVPVLTAIGLSQAIQIPIALCATVANAYTGVLDARLGVTLGLGLCIGTWAGARLAHIAPRSTLKAVVSCLLIAVGGLILVKLGQGAMHWLAAP